MTGHTPAAGIIPAAGAAPDRPVVRVAGLSKTFGPVRVLNGVDLDLFPGKVHALIGENGSGKSTLIKCLSGFHAPDQGSRIELDGDDVTRGVADCDFAFVHQDLGLVPGVSILENVALVQGFGAGSALRIRWRAERRRVAGLLERYGIASDPMAPVARLGAPEQALLAILRTVEATGGASRLLVLDEPTAALPEAGRARVLSIVREMARRGVAVLYVSHRLREVLSIADSITVLRDGSHFGPFPVDGLTEADLVKHMMGRDLDAAGRRSAARAIGDVTLQVEGLTGLGVHDLSFEVRAGEILSLTGLLGAGQDDVGKLVFGAAARSAGRILVDGRQVRASDPASAIRSGIAYIPADRVHESAMAFMSVRENVTLPKLGEFARGGRLQRRAERGYTARLMREFDVRPAQPEHKMRQLSGGNQQKAIVGKWLGIHPKVLVLAEPTQGVDIGARAEIYRFIAQAADDGAAVLLVDTDLEEVARLSDRVLVLSDGRLVGSLASDEITRLQMLELMNKRQPNAAVSA